MLFGSVREHYHFYGERNRDNRPRALSVFLVNEDGNQERILLPVDEHPFSLSLPLMPGPGILLGRDIKHGYESNYQWITKFDGDTVRRSHAISMSHGGQPVSILNIPLGDFCKFLAKTAYTFSIFFMGLESIEPLVVDLILSARTDALEGPY
jgi:hypothetical protein